MKSSELQSAFLQLVRLGIGHGTGTESVQGSWTSQAAKPSARFKVQGSIDWQGVKDLAERQGLSAVVLDGIERLPDQQRPPKVFLLEWIGETLQGYEYRYEQYCKAIAELAGFYNKHGFKMMILKGYACSLDWPKPEHRPCGDIDIWQFGRQAEADALIKSLKFKVESLKSVDSGELKVGSIKIDRSHHHHTVFYWRDFMVENHYDFISVYHHKSHARLEKLFKELGTFKVDSGEFNDNGQLKWCSVEGCKIPSVEVYGEQIYLPSPNLHALFLLKHTMLHFVSGEINLRQIIDWGFFVEKHGNEVDWKWLMDVLEKYGMLPAFNIFNAICVEDLGFEASLFPQVQFSPIVKDRALKEILHAESTNDGPKGLLTNLIYRYRRWKDSAWKHELCYKESMWSAFWYGVWGHIIKPKSI